MTRLRKLIDEANELLAELTVGVRTLPIEIVDAYKEAAEKLEKVTFVDLLDDEAITALLAMKWYDLTGSVENAINIWEGKTSVYTGRHSMVADLAMTFRLPTSPGYLGND